MQTESKRLEYNKEYYLTNKESLILKKKEYRQKNKEKILEYNRSYRLKNKESLQNKEKIYREKIIDKTIEYRQANKDKIKKYFIDNKAKINIQKNTYQKNKKENDILFKLKCNLSCRIYHALNAKKYIKSQRTLEMLGCDLETIKSHLEKQFIDGMNWSNKGDWHIDHIIPCASAKTEEELIKLFHYTNLQPLWAIDNILKKDKIIEKQLFLL